MAAIAAVALLLTGCATSPQGGPNDALTVYATTGYLADTVANIAPEAVITTMVGPGGDPHTYQPSTRDIQTIQKSDLVLWNGLHLEAQMTNLLGSLGDRQLAVGNQLPSEVLLPWPETNGKGDQLHDPHVWNSPKAWSLVVGQIADKLGALDPDNANEYRAHAAAYQTKIQTAATEAENLLAGIPEPRIIITGHDAFAYFGEAYDLQVHATDFISTEAQLSPQQLSELASLIANNRVPVIFKDNQANPQAITSLREAVRALGWQVEISDKELYADSLGADPGVDTYLGVFRHNSEAIADALGRK